MQRQYQRKTWKLFDPKSSAPFELSRTKIDLFIECPHCFYLDRRFGIARPAGFPFTLNSAVDALLKKEFDIHRARKTAHPLMDTYGIEAVPLAHKNMDTWRENFIGVRALHEASNFLVFGAVDDIWVNAKDELMVVDYKSTSKDGEVNLDAEWQDGYKRQMETYQWLLRQNGFAVSDVGYFVYANGKKDREAFDGKLEFDIQIISYKGKADWIEKVLMDIRACLTEAAPPPVNPQCEYCGYIAEAAPYLGIKETASKAPKKEPKKEPKKKEEGGNSIDSLF